MCLKSIILPVKSQMEWEEGGSCFWF